MTSNELIVTAKVTDQNPKAYFVQVEGRTYQLDKTLCQDQVLKLGQDIQGFAYEDKDHKPLFQIEIPPILKGEFVWAVVTQVRKDLGVFVDVGIRNKDIVVSLDDLPDQKQHWPQKGDQVYVNLFIDIKQRFWGKLAHQEDFRPLFIKASDRLMNQDLEATIYQLKLDGVQLISKEGFPCFIHSSEWILPPRLGEQVQGRVTHVHKDGSLNLSLRPRAHEAIDDDARMLLQLLDKQAEGFLPLHDKSDPEVIQTKLGISKAQFKRAVGSLLKQGSIRQEKGLGIFLLNQAGNEEGEANELAERP